jgi:hypothetical protein
MTRNLVPILEKDVDGANSLPLRLDGEVPNLGKFAACRRVARTIGTNPGLDCDAKGSQAEDPTCQRPP